MQLSGRSKWLIGIAAGIGAYVVFAQKDPSTAEPIRAATAAGVRSAHAASAPVSATHALLQLAHRVSDQAAAGALFATHSWYVAPPPPPPAPAVKPEPPPKPVAPPLPFAYMGSYAPNGVQPVFFLTRGDRVYDVRVGDTLDGTYSVDGFANGQLTLTYKPLNEKQQLMTGSTP